MAVITKPLKVLKILFVDCIIEPQRNITNSILLLMQYPLPLP
jgi:hypothetical protein